MEERRLDETAYVATRAKLQQLAQDAQDKAAEFTDLGRPRDAIHYTGMRDGLLRAINVLDGKG